MLNILLVIAGCSLYQVSADKSMNTPDSLRLETRNGMSVVIHRVEKGETLSSISRRYGASLSAVLKSNPGADSGIAAGQEIMIPYAVKSSGPSKGDLTHVVEGGQTLFSIARQYSVTVDQIKIWNNLGEKNLQAGMKLLIRKPVSTPSVSTLRSADQAVSSDNDLIHEVAEKETLFSISKKYRVPVDEIIRWNNLSSSSLRLGQKLTIKIFNPVIKVDVPEDNTKPVATPSPVPVVKSPEVRPMESAKDTEKNETGFALLYERSGDSRKYLAYHRTIPEGTVLRVRNKDNKKEIFVRIAGKLPDNESNDVLIRISRAAWEKLGGTDRFPAEIIFFD